MFALIAALTTIPQRREGREALHYENDVRTGHGAPSTRIYRESSAERRARKDLAAVRRMERVQQQLKFVRLMKKLLVRIDQDTVEDDADVEQMRVKVGQLQVKVKKAAHDMSLACDDVLDLNRPDDAEDIALEQAIRDATASTEVQRPACADDWQAGGDHSSNREADVHRHGRKASLEFGAVSF